MLDAQHDVAGPRGFRETHRRRGDLPRRVDPLDPLQLLAAVFGLGVLLAVGVPPDEVLRLGDFGLLLLVGPPLDLQPLGLLPLVGREVARVGIHRAAEQLQRAVGHLVQEVAVVADHDHRLVGLEQEALQPLGGFDVQVVGRLVQQHQVGLVQQQLGQHQPVLLAAAELFDRLAERLAAEAQAVQHPFDLVIQVVGVAVLQFVLQVVEPLAQPAALGFVLGFGQRGRHPFRVAAKRHQVAERVVRLVPDRVPRRELGLLFEESDPRRTRQLDRARVRILAPGQAFSSVVLPDPLGPTNAIRSPARTSNVTPSSTGSGP